MARATPHGTITFLFTDLEGSTDRWEGDAAAMTAELEVHDRIVVDVASARSGHIFATGGDGFAIAFDRASDAVDAALVIQRELTASTSLRSRMGLHSGEAIERDGDYFGPDVIRAARVMALGHGGQVLLTTTTSSLVGEGYGHRDLGRHELKGLSRPVGVVQLVHPGLVDVTLTLRTGAAAVGNLPVPMSSFIGRVREMADITDAVREHRLVSLVGVGGTGKTRLAIETASATHDDFGDGVWFVDLSPVADASGVAERFLEGLEIPVAAGVEHVDRLVDATRRWSSLLVVDNCEHVLDAVAGVLQRLMAEAPTIHVLATSREPLLLDGEHIVGVPSLSTGTSGDNDSVRLFVARLTEAGVSTGSAESLQVVADICRRLDGIPLAIELAASCARTMPLEAVRDRLDERFRLLRGGRRATAERHQTLRAAIDWSYQLLPPTERSVFDRLSVFAGGFTLGEAGKVCADDEIDEQQVMDAVTALVDRSTLTFDPAAPRPYRLLETLRSFGREALDAAGDADAVCLRHAAHFASVSRQVAVDLFGPHEAEAAQRYARASSEMRAAVLWAANAGEHALVEEFIPAMHVLPWTGSYDSQGWVTEIDHLLPRTPTILGLRMHVAVFNQADVERGRRLAHEALAMPDNAAALYSAHRILGLIAVLFDGDHDAALRHMRAEKTVCAASPNRHEQLLGGIMLELFLPTLGRPSEGFGPELLERAQGLQWATGIAMAHYLIGRADEQEAPEAAIEAYRRSAAAASLVDNDNVWCWATRERAVLELVGPKRDDAFTDLLEVLRRHVAIGAGMDSLSTLGCVAIGLARLGHHRLAAVALGHIDDRSRPVGASARQFDVALADVRLAVGDDWGQLAARGRAMSIRDLAASIDDDLAEGE